MIDYFNITIEIDHQPFGSIRTKQHENGNVKTKCFTKTLYINHVPFYVTSMDNGSRINIRCCPLKLFQGHNLFGSNSLKKLWCSLIVELLNLLGIQASPVQLRKWLRGEFQVDGIHITHRFPVSEYPLVGQVIAHIRRYSSELLLPTPIIKGVGVTLRAPHGQADWLFYDKRQEFGDKRTKEQKYLQAVVGDLAERAKDRLLQVASMSIRAELKLGKRYLQDNGLDRGNAWTVAKAIEVFISEFDELGIGQIPSLPQLPDVYAAIENPKLRMVVIMWANGEDITRHFGVSTVRKYRTAVMDEMGIDILKDAPVLEPASIILSDIFNSDNMLTGFPKWVRKYPEIALR